MEGSQGLEIGARTGLENGRGGTTFTVPAWRTCKKKNAYEKVGPFGVPHAQKSCNVSGNDSYCNHQCTISKKTRRWIVLFFFFIPYSDVEWFANCDAMKWHMVPMPLSRASVPHVHENTHDKVLGILRVFLVVPRPTEMEPNPLKKHPRCVIIYACLSFIRTCVWNR